MASVDIVNVDAATRRGILVTNVPNDWCQNEVADHAMALLLAAARNICTHDRRGVASIVEVGHLAVGLCQRAEGRCGGWTGRTCT